MWMNRLSTLVINVFFIHKLQIIQIMNAKCFSPIHRFFTFSFLEKWEQSAWLVRRKEKYRNCECGAKGFKSSSRNTFRVVRSMLWPSCRKTDDVTSHPDFLCSLTSAVSSAWEYFSVVDEWRKNQTFLKKTSSVGKDYSEAESWLKKLTKGARRTWYIKSVY